MGRKFMKDEAVFNEPLNIGFKGVRLPTLEDLLIYTRGNQTEAARIVNINRGTIRKIINDRLPAVLHETKVGDVYQYRLLWCRS